ncbi:DUF6266 family protein [Algoriphagus formosus]|uniref:Uncharacterized protein n=1 Tax=Algoriphagus formosus TaxID=2007308 RepID=A0A4R5USP8_9BACT|nr:DUF6266 family protein [Algoriphagus aquimaris]TDK42051.1 hypothetical protein E1898_18945 [Algoriphagus aquimaris]
MANIDVPLLSFLKGKLGSLVIYQVNGKTVVRKKPSKKRVYKPSKHQLFNQMAFREVQRLLMPLKEVLAFGYGPHLIGMQQGVHLAMSYAMKHAVRSEGGKVKLLPAQIQISLGDLPLPESIVFEKSIETGEISVSWEYVKSWGTARDSDFTWIVAYHIPSGKYREFRAKSFRSKKSQKIKLPTLFMEKGSLFFFSFYRSSWDQKLRFSNSYCWEVP